MARHITPAELRAHLNKAGVPVVYETDWNAPYIDPYKSSFTPVGVVLHHTAGKNSLAFCMRGTFPPVRNCQFLVDRDGTIHCIAGSGAYHAGLGGPMRINNTRVPKDAGNRFFYGIEIESLGTRSYTDAMPDDANGFTPAQVKSVALLSAALVRLLKSNEDAVTRHRDWAPGRKIDVLQPLEWWKEKIASCLPIVDSKLHPVPTGAWDKVVPNYGSVKQASRNGVPSIEAGRVAARLYDLGFYKGPKPGPTHAYPKRAVRAFKRAKLLGLTGSYTPATHNAIFGV